MRWLGLVFGKMPKFRLALVQMKSGLNKAENLSKALQFIKDAAQVHGAKEFFSSPFGSQYFEEYAEPIPGPTTEALAAAAKKNQVYLIGGSIPERSGRCGERIYNTATVFGPDGSLLCIHRKIHLFDVDMPGELSFRESDNLSPGSKFCLFDTDDCKIGVAICHDIRFPELAMCYADLDCDLLVYPAAFEMITGRAHWKLLLQMRALDNQMYVAGASPARNESADFVAWAHSQIVNPWGDVVAEADHTERIVVGEIGKWSEGFHGRIEGAASPNQEFLSAQHPQYMLQVREQIPIRKQRRSDLYRLKSPLVP